ncbi:hypothetical protein [Streptomyces sp. SAI-149]|uniref:hypothetical protein n=1 Tax=unclassified Streptomyces TaxID=2593676 RepID=UPI002476E39A|nr:hypothetical protein [Streptomyces sp. SAI-149]MDH6502622.1 hypothetical protein [Streptomyces sp. SAI-149]
MAAVTVGAIRAGIPAQADVGEGRPGLRRAHGGGCGLAPTGAGGEAWAAFSVARRKGNPVLRNGKSGAAQWQPSPAQRKRDAA